MEPESSIIAQILLVLTGAVIALIVPLLTHAYGSKNHWFELKRDLITELDLFFISVKKLSDSPKQLNHIEYQYLYNKIVISLNSLSTRYTCSRRRNLKIISARFDQYFSDLLLNPSFEMIINKTGSIDPDYSKFLNALKSGIIDSENRLSSL